MADRGFSSGDSCDGLVIDRATVGDVPSVVLATGRGFWSRLEVPASCRTRNFRLGTEEKALVLLSVDGLEVRPTKKRRTIASRDTGGGTRC